MRTITCHFYVDPVCEKLGDTMSGPPFAYLEVDGFATDVK
jgi:hypothetical protein